jgi:hypothetical protein
MLLYPLHLIRYDNPATIIEATQILKASKLEWTLMINMTYER